MNKEQIRYSILALVLLIFFIGSYQLVKIRDINIKDLDQELGKIELKNSVKADDKDLRNIYGLDSKDLDSYIFYRPKTNMDAEEILICKTENPQEIKEKVDKRIEKQEESFKNYARDKYDLLEDRYYQVEGDYLILVVSEKKDDLVKVIKGGKYESK